MAFWAAAIPSIISAVGSIAGAVSANDANKESAKDNQYFQKTMSGTAHQREVDDLKAAGLNPLLSANAGASTPQGATYQSENITAGAAASAAEIYKRGQEDQALGLQEKSTNAQVDLAHRQGLAAQASARKANAEAKLLENEAGKSGVMNFLWQKGNKMLDTTAKEVHKQFQDSRDPEKRQKLQNKMPEGAFDEGRRVRVPRKD